MDTKSKFHTSHTHAFSDKLPQLLFDIIVHPYASHKAAALRIISSQTIADDLIKRICEYISKNGSEETVLVMKVLISVIHQGQHQMIRDTSKELFTHLFSVLVEPRSSLSNQSLILIEELTKCNNIQHVSDLGDDIMNMFCKAMRNEEIMRDKQ
jgi:hypothetical protein